MTHAAVPNRRRWLIEAGVSALVALPAAHAGTPWPQRPVQLVVAYPPGGVSDEVARLLAERLAGRLGVAVVVRHRPGASGTLAFEHLSRAPADGHTLLWSAITPLTVLPLMMRLGFDPTRDVVPVMAVMATPLLLLATPALAAHDLPSALQQARQIPGGLRWASSGSGTTGHLVLAHTRQASGAPIVHIPYKGGGQQINDALGGQFHLLSSNLAPQQLAHVRQGRLRALALGAPERSSTLPGVPTLAELGLPQANLWSTFGLFAPAGTPADRLNALNRAAQAVLGEPTVQSRLRAIDNRPLGGSAQALALRIQQERVAAEALWGLGGLRETG